MIIEKAEALLRIDKDELDREVMQQPEIFYNVAKELVMAISLRDASSDKLDLVDAEIDADIRANSTEKLTEAKIKQMIIRDEEHIKASEDYLLSKNLVDRWAILKEAFVQRATMLRELASLTIAGFVVTSTVGQGSFVGREAKYEESRKRLRDDKSI